MDTHWNVPHSCFIRTLLFLYEYTQGRYMTGDGDGISQMLPFKSCCMTNTSKETSLFLSIWSRRRYIYAIRLLFYNVDGLYGHSRCCLAVKCASPCTVNRHSLWANAVIWLSVIKLTVILFIAYRVLLSIVQHRLGR